TRWMRMMISRTKSIPQCTAWRLVVSTTTTNLMGTGSIGRRPQPLAPGPFRQRPAASSRVCS
ncbi:hypothetical protein C8R44DRAFT_793189, partial [Mycena epipterygia]